MKEYLNNRLRLVEFLWEKAPMKSYGDAVLILTAVLSACATWRWPGKGKDRERFIRLLTEYSLPDHHADWVCIPALINEGILKESETPYHNNEIRIFTDEEIDLSPSDAKVKYPSLMEGQLRKYNYASLIYEYLRCGYAHEYVPHETITHVPATRRVARISYIGRLGTDFDEITKMMCFHLDYLFNLAEHHVSVLPWEKPDEG